MIKWLNFYIYYIAIGSGVFTLGWMISVDIVPKPFAIGGWLLSIGYAWLAHGYRSMWWESEQAAKLMEFIKTIEKSKDGDAEVTSYTFDESKTSRDSKDQTKED